MQAVIAAARTNQNEPMSATIIEQSEPVPNVDPGYNHANDHDEETCIRCGDTLDTPEGVATGICPGCWIPADELDGPPLPDDGPRAYIPARYSPPVSIQNPE